MIDVPKHAGNHELADLSEHAESRRSASWQKYCKSESCRVDHVRNQEVAHVEAVCRSSCKRSQGHGNDGHGQHEHLQQGMRDQGIGSSEHVDIGVSEHVESSNDDDSNYETGARASSLPARPVPRRSATRRRIPDASKSTASPSQSTFAPSNRVTITEDPTTITGRNQRRRHEHDEDNDIDGRHDNDNDG